MPTRKRVLLVDDEPDFLDVLGEHLAHSYDVDTAESGEAALQRFGAQRPDLVFLDISMPGLSGVDVLRTLRVLDPAVPIIMVTANTNIGVTEECLKLGAFSWIPKPFDLRYVDHIAALATGQ